MGLDWFLGAKGLGAERMAILNLPEAIFWRTWLAYTIVEEGKSLGEGIEGPLSQRVINGDSTSSRN